MSLAIIEGKKAHVSKNFVRVSDMLDYAVEKASENGTIYINMDGTEEKVSYKEQKEKALGVLATLQKHGIKKGDCIVVDVSENKDYHIMMWACFYGGIVITTLPRPDFSNEASESVKGFKNIWTLLKEPVVITDQNMMDSYSQVMKINEVYSMESLYSNQIGEIIDVSTDDIAYIQFSSGSTGNKKGTLLSNKNLISASCNIVAHEDTDENERPLMWLPHTHNFGAFTFTLLALVLACDSWSMGTEIFVRNPLLFMQKVSEHKITRLCMNNLGVQILLGLAMKVPNISFDLSELRAIYIGSEKPDPELLKKFSYVYKKEETVFRPGYGMSETALTVCSTFGFSSKNLLRISRKETSRQQKIVLFEGYNFDDCCTVVEHGIPITNTTIGIFNEDGTLRQEGEVGSIRIKSPAVFQGYCGVDSLDGIIEDGWYITGDIGFIYEGKVYITGREKDIFIVRGVNYMITDLEAFLEEKIGLRGKIALIASEKEKEDKLVAIVEYELNDENTEEFIRHVKNIRQALMSEYGLEVDEVLPLPQLKRNASRKVDRYGMKKEFQNGEYDTIVEKVHALNIKDNKEKTYKSEFSDSLTDEIRNCWAEILEIPNNQISNDVSFKSLGGNSVKGYYLIQKIEECLKSKRMLSITINQNILAKCSTVQEMTDYIVELNEKSQTKTNVCREAEVAITGLAFRLPGASTQDELWNLLTNGVDCVHKVSDKRKNLCGDQYWDDIFGEIEDIDQFDYEFFNISKEEADFMDPQQRLSMEVAYEALDDSGEGVITDEEKNIAVLAATSGNSYLPLLFKYAENKGFEDMPETTMVGNLGSTIATRVSQYMNSRGVSFALDSACSSFMVSLLMGEKMVKSGECEGALVLGANIFPSSHTHSLAKKAGILSKGNCTKVFDKHADGSLLGEGVVAVYIEGLSHAQKNKKRIYGVIAGGAFNNDGASLSIMAPNPAGQYDVLEKSYKDAGVDIHKISYIEAHGTGTQIGDPIELSALQHMFHEIGEEKTGYKIPIGSIKSNFGHLLPCAGGAGLVKTLLCMKNEKLVPSIHINEVNPLLERKDFPFSVLTDVKEWKRSEEGRYAGISSFGIGGTNAHVIIKDAPLQSRKISEEKMYLVTGSAKDPDTLVKVKGNLLNSLKVEGNSAQDISYTSTKGRKHYKHRCAFLIDENKNVCSEISSGITYRINGNKIALVCDETKINDEIKVIMDSMKKITNGKCVLTNGKEDMKVDYLIYINFEPSELKNNKIQSKETRVLNIDMSKENSQIYFELIKELYACGANIDWNRLLNNEDGIIITLPSYPFAKTKAWINV